VLEAGEVISKKELIEAIQSAIPIIDAFNEAIRGESQ